MFKIGFNKSLIAHNSILRKMNEQYHVLIDIQTIQVWMIAIVMKMNQYFIKYKSLHSIFCLRFLPQKENQQSKETEHDLQSLYHKIQRAFKLLEQSEKEMVSDNCWTFIIDLSELNDKNDPKITQKSRELYDDDVITENKYNKDFKMNQLYHLKKLDYLICKENDNSSTMALQVSFHKYWTNNCVSWLTHSSGHIPFIESDIIQFIPKLFKTVNGIKDNEWKEIVNKNKIIEIKSMDRMYSELEQSYNNFINN